MDNQQTVKLSELKQNPSRVVARAQAGETFVVTVQNRPAAMLGPIPETHRWATRADYEAYRALPPLPPGEAEAWLADSREDDETIDDLVDPFEP